MTEFSNRGIQALCNICPRDVWPRQQIKTCAHVQCTWNRNLEKPPFDSVETMVGERKKGSFDINSERYGNSEINDL